MSISCLNHNGFNVESWPKAEKGILALSNKHFKEVVDYEDGDLDINVDYYRMAYKHKSIRVYTARKKSKLIGYSVFVVSFHPHYRKSLRAVQDSIFLDTPHRKGSYGMKFIRWCEDQLRKEGVEYVYQTSGRKHNIGPIFEKMGYEPIESIYMRRL